MKAVNAESLEPMISPSPEGHEKTSPESAHPHTEEKRIAGASLSKGLAIGHVVLYEPCLTGTEIVSDNTQAQIQRLRQAVDSMHEAINRMLHHRAAPTIAETREIG